MIRRNLWSIGIVVSVLSASLCAPSVAQQQGPCCTYQVQHNFKFCLNQGRIAQGIWFWNLKAFVAPPSNLQTNAGAMPFTIPPTPFSQSQTVFNQLLGPNGEQCALSAAVATIFIDQVPGTNCYTGYHRVAGEACVYCRGYSAASWGTTGVFLFTFGVQNGLIGWQPIIRDRASAGCGIRNRDPVKLVVRDTATGQQRSILLFDLESSGFDIELGAAGEELMINPVGDLDGDAHPDTGYLRIRMDGREVAGLSGDLELEYQNGLVTRSSATGDLSRIPLPRVGEPIRPIRTGVREVPLRFDVPPHLVLEGIEVGGGGQAGEIPTIEGDVNGDGCVDDADLLAVLFAFGSSGSDLPEDVNGDGVVDDADLLIVLFNFGSGC